METAIPTKVLSKDNATTGVVNRNYEPITTYYDIAGPDYEVWSPGFNMHFGYARSFTDIFSLEKMLVNMSKTVLDELHIDKTQPSAIADLGCGVGAVARLAAQQFPLSSVTGVTISQYQVEKGMSLIQKENLDEQVSILTENFEHLSFPDETFTHAYALESACHAAGSNKELFIAEMVRTLKKGGRFAIADGFLKPVAKRPAFFNKLHKRIAEYWAVPCFAHIAEFENTLKAYGLKNIKIREISLRLAPSVMYVPWTCLKFFAREIRRNKSLRMKKERWNNIYAPLLGMIFGLYRKQFGYFIISGNK